MNPLCQSLRTKLQKNYLFWIKQMQNFKINLIISWVYSSVESRNDSEFHVKKAVTHPVLFSFPCFFPFRTRKNVPVFDIPTYHTYHSPQNLKKLCSWNDSEYGDLPRRLWPSVWWRDCNICGGPELGFRTRHVRTSRNISLNCSSLGTVPNENLLGSRTIVPTLSASYLPTIL